MSWSDQRSRKRIAEFLVTVPALDETISLEQQNRILAEARAKKGLDQISARRAFVVEGAHLYGELLDFDDVVAERDGHETESSQRSALSFLSMHYRLWDEIAQDEDANRVDYHGSRMHSVVTDPEGDARAQIQRAVALAVRLGTATKEVAARFGFPSRIRFGIDQGRCS
jgi:hypothetical protein